ncbi:MAG: hypothetical protein ABR906_04640 [Terracidiphilus sp.]|jgi:hypothetical protein
MQFRAAVLPSGQIVIQFTTATGEMELDSKENDETSQVAHLAIGR